MPTYSTQSELFSTAGLSASLVNFRQRLEEHGQSALGFQTVLDALVEAGLVSRQSRQRLDSTQMFGRMARMNRLDCVRESLRLALKELEAVVAPEARPGFWVGLWERYMESQTDMWVTRSRWAKRSAKWCWCLANRPAITSRAS